MVRRRYGGGIESWKQRGTKLVRKGYVIGMFLRYGSGMEAGMEAGMQMVCRWYAIGIF